MKKNRKKKSFFRAGAFLCAMLLFWCDSRVIIASQLSQESEEASQAQPAEAEEPKLSIQISDGQSLKRLQDKNHRTRLSFEEGTVFTIEHAEAVTGLYIIWDKLPGEWTLRVDGAEYTYGKQGFLHEYIPLQAGSAVLEAVVPSDMEICEFHAFENGEIPEWVQVWQEPLEEADMLLIPTHADDEILFFGPIIPTYVEQGYKLQVVYLTNHWNSHVRPHELLNGLWTSGIRAYPIIGPFEDIYSSNLKHAMTLYDNDEVLEYFVEMLRRFQPKVVIGHDLGGEYGHGVHMLNADMLTKALEISGDETAYPDSAAKYGTWDVPKTYLHLFEENCLEFEWDTPLSGFDGLTAFEVAQKAFECHQSQRDYFEVTRSKNVYGCTQFGLYRSLVGADTKRQDFFENIDFDDYKPKPTLEELKHCLPLFLQKLLFG